MSLISSVLLIGFTAFCGHLLVLVFTAMPMFFLPDFHRCFLRRKDVAEVAILLFLAVCSVASNKLRQQVQTQGSLVNALHG